MTFSTPFAFKEWALVCEALGSGDQSLLLRKGGIAEGKNGFCFEHGEFFLFPTWFHGQLEKTRLQQASAVLQEVPDLITLEYAVVVEWSRFIQDRKKVAALDVLHILDKSVVEERFNYNVSLGGEGIHLAFVRVYRINPLVTLPMEKRFGGCRSWLKLPEMPEVTLIPVLNDEEHAKRRLLLNQILCY